MLYVPQVSRGPTYFYMQYQVLARKYRPQNFHELVGQDHVSRTLMNALQGGRLAHAFLFSGPRGSGKTTTARVLAKALNCHAGAPGEPCGKCVACTEIAAGNCLDVLEVDAASNTGVDNVRNLIEQVQYNPARDRNKIFIIDEVHMLSTAAFNALLKTLEEPPPHVKFILATTEYHKIPATILSRCQQYSFKLIPIPLILERLKTIAAAEKIRISQEALEQVAYASGGSMRDAMSALDQVIAFSGDQVRDEDATMLLGLVEPAVLGKTTRAIAASDAGAILDTVAALVESGQDLQNFSRRLLSHFRNLMVLKAGVTDASVIGMPESQVAQARTQAELFSREELLRSFDALLKVENELKQATQIRFQLEMGLLEVAQLPKLRSLEELIADFTRLVRGEPVTGPPAGGGTGRPAAPEPRPETPLERSGAPPQRSEPAPRSDPPAPPRRAAAPPPEPVAAAESPAPAPDSTESAPSGGKELLQRIADALQRPSLETHLHGLSGAELQGDEVHIDLQPLNEFLRRQIRDAGAALSAAASTVIGRPVRVVLVQGTSPSSPPAASQQPVRRAAPPPVSLPSDSDDPLERAKREPVVQSFLEMFPGPVKAEKIDQ
jgi:DNA polymerase III subunit gamma/tau